MKYLWLTVWRLYPYPSALWIASLIRSISSCKHSSTWIYWSGKYLSQKTILNEIRKAFTRSKTTIWSFGRHARQSEGGCPKSSPRDAIWMKYWATNTALHYNFLNRTPVKFLLYSSNSYTVYFSVTVLYAKSCKIQCNFLQLFLFFVLQSTLYAVAEFTFSSYPHIPHIPA